MKSDKTLFVVHCVDTEGPLNEKIGDTFNRLRSIFGIELEPTHDNLLALQESRIDLHGLEDAVARCFSPELMAYNRDWAEIDQMLDKVMSKEFRVQIPDDFGNGWVYSWHCMDHVGVVDNPRAKDLGYGKIFRHYRDRLAISENQADELNWHFHPLSISRKSTDAATSFVNSYQILYEIICRRIIEFNWFPVVNRPGFHAERQDSNLFLEQWIPYDYANQFTEDSTNQPDLMNGRFGDWRRSPSTWRGYHPSHDDYQTLGQCRRVIFRCLNVGTRVRTLTDRHIIEAFSEAEQTGKAILAVANHDWRDIEQDVSTLASRLKEIQKTFQNVSIRYSGAEAAASALYEPSDTESLELDMEIRNTTVLLKVIKGEIFGPQPFLAIRDLKGNYFHDNLDIVVPGREWSYILDGQTLPPHEISIIAAASAGRFGGYSVARHEFTQSESNQKTN